LRFAGAPQSPEDAAAERAAGRERLAKLKAAVAR
jgi:hypothetical protein